MEAHEEHAANTCIHSDSGKQERKKLLELCDINLSNNMIAITEMYLYAVTNNMSILFWCKLGPSWNRKKQAHIELYAQLNQK